MVYGTQEESDAFAYELARTARLCAELDAATRAFRTVIERMRDDDALQRRARAIVSLCATMRGRR